MFYAANTLSTNIDSWRKFEVSDLYNELKRQASEWFNSVTQSGSTTSQDDIRSIASLQTFLDHLSTRHDAFLERDLAEIVTYSINQKFDFMNWLNTKSSTPPKPLIQRLIQNPSSDITFDATGYSAFETKLKAEIKTLRDDFMSGSITSQVSTITKKVNNLFDTEIQKYGLTPQQLPANSFTKSALDDTISSIHSILDSSTTYYNDKYPFKTYATSLQTTVALLNSKMASQAFKNDIESIAETYTSTFLRDEVTKVLKTTASTRDWVKWQHYNMDTVAQLDTLFTPGLQSIISGFNSKTTAVKIQNKVTISKIADIASTHKTNLLLNFEVAINGVIRNVSTTISVETYDYPIETLTNYISTHITGPNLFIPIMGDKATVLGPKTLEQLEALQTYHDGAGMSEDQYKAFIQQLKDIKHDHPTSMDYHFSISETIPGQYELQISAEHTTLNSWESSRRTLNTKISVQITNELDAIATDIIHKIEAAKANPVIGATINEFLYMNDLVKPDGTPKPLNYATSLEASVLALSKLKDYLTSRGITVNLVGEHIISPSMEQPHPLLAGELWLSGSGSHSGRYKFQLPISESNNALDDFVASLAQTKHVDYGFTNPKDPNTILDETMVGKPISEASLINFIPSWRAKKDFALKHHLTFPDPFIVRYNAGSKTFFIDVKVSDGTTTKSRLLTLKRYLYDSDVAQLRNDVEQALSQYESVLSKYQKDDMMVAAQLAIINQYRVDFIRELNTFPQDKVPSSFKEKWMNEIATFKNDAYLGPLIVAAQSGVLEKLMQRYGGMDKIPADILDKLKNLSADTLNKLKELSPEKFVDFLSNGHLMDHLDTFVDSLSHLLNMETVMTESFKMGVVGTAGVMGVASMGAGVTAVRIAGANRKARKQKNKTKISSSKGLFITSSLVAITTALGSVGMMLYVFISQGGF